MERNTSWFKPELWGGMECTINRVGDVYQDQLQYTGYYERHGDLNSFAELGFKKFRLPLLWEKHQQKKNTIINWSWAEAQLNELKNLEITPIAGLLHHGSGPAFTNLEDPEFPLLFASYAGEVAKRFPEIEYYTPINEPLTTARFSGLYGLWYPHKKNDNSFARMVINQARATVLAMMAIRKINPSAKLVQTEDLGKIYSTEKLRYQANFENARRWLTFDLLNGKVNSSHPLWSYFLNAGIEEHELKFLIANPCPPDLIGCNYYITSERFLDHEIEHYHPDMIGGNGRHRYADVEAIRVQHESPSGLKVLIREIWNRYRIPLALSEVQLHCHRDDQAKWFYQAWSDIISLQNENIDIRAITSWALLGAFGWNKLLTEMPGEYESGAFDVRSGKPRPTAVYNVIKSLNNKEEKIFAFLQNPGWWERDNRFIKRSRPVTTPVFLNDPSGAPILIIGKRGTLGKAFARICANRCINYKLIGRDDADITEQHQVEKLINLHKPWAIINAAGFVRVDDAEKEINACFLSNCKGPEILARLCKAHGIQLINFSSDLVFNGSKSSPYVESDRPFPLNVYGQSKAESEKQLCNLYPESLIIRTSAFFGPWDEYNFAHQVLHSIENGQPFFACNDQFVSPTYVPDLVNHSLDLLVDEEKSIWHLANNGSVSWFQFAEMIAERAGKASQLIVPQPSSAFGLLARRPAYSVLVSEKGASLPALEHAIDRFIVERSLFWAPKMQSSAA